jgi:hypothetical protein
VQRFTIAELTTAQATEKQAEAEVACPLFVQTDPLTPYGFARANLASLWYARNSVRDALAEMKQSPADSNAFSTLTAMMRSTKVSTNDFICAKRVVKEYASTKTHLTSATASQKDSVQTAAKFTMMVYDQHIDINRRMLDLLSCSFVENSVFNNVPPLNEPANLSPYATGSNT